MAYKELIKNFSKIRSYLKEFFVYGYNSRGNVGRKSERSYDDEKRRIQSWLGDYVEESHGPDGKTTALSIDVRNVGFNPLYRAWKSASFTDKDITLHFILMDILKDRPAIPLSEIISLIYDEYLSGFDKPMEFDESTIRKKLAEYGKQGLVVITKEGNKSVYSLSKNSPELFGFLRAAPLGEGVAEDGRPGWSVGKAFPSQIQNALDFSSEILPVGIIGSTLLDKMDERENCFSFKHHYITQALDSEIMLRFFEAIRKKSWVQIHTLNERKNTKENPRGTVAKIVPLKIISSSQTGRQYVVAHVVKRKKLKSFRLDNILEVKLLEVCPDFDNIKRVLKEAERFLWGASFGNFEQPETVEFTVKFRDDEEHIYQRLIREKRCGQVERISQNEARFSATVWDVHEMFIWIRTFIMRITELHISDKELEKYFWDDVQKMMDNYKDML